MEQLEYLIRTLTYKRSCWELDYAKLINREDFGNYLETKGKIEGIDFAITEIHKLVKGLDK